VLQAAGDLGLQEEAPAAVRVVGAVVEDALEGHLAVQVAVEGHEDLAQASLRMELQGAEPLRRGRRRGRSRAWRSPPDFLVGRRPVLVDRGDRRAFRLGGGDGGTQPFEHGPADVQAGDAPLGIAVGLDVQRDQRVDGCLALRVEVPQRDQVLGQGSGLVSRPGLDGRHELALLYQAHLEGQQAEEQVAGGLFCATHDGLLAGGRARGNCGAMRGHH
jgi:hypothetical protein